MLYLEAKDCSCSPAELYFGKHKVAEQPYLAYAFNRLVTGWGRAIDNKLSEYDKEGKRVHDLGKLLRLDEIGRPQPQRQALPSGQQTIGHASKQKKANLLSKEEIARRWAAQVDAFDKEAGDAISYH